MKTKTKNKDWKIEKLFLTILIIVSFIFSASLIFADTLVPTATLDTSVENKIKVCKDPTCENPLPDIIDFRKNDGYPLSIEKGKYIVGKAWSEELGWITFDSSPGGVYISDPETGILRGIAWSEKSGAINFGVTGQELKIDPFSGEWSGFAWASGPLGGWIKFNCKEYSCLRMVWEKTNNLSTFDTTFPLQENESSNFVPMFPLNINGGEIISRIQESLSSSFAYISDSLSFSLAYIFDNSSFTFAYDSNKFFSTAITSLSSNVYSTLRSFTSDVSSGLAGLYIGTSGLATNTYDTLSSSMISARASVIDSLFSFFTKDFSLASNTFSRKLPVSTRSPQFSQQTSPSSPILGIGEIFANSFNTFALSTTDLFNKTTKLIDDTKSMTGNAYASYSSFLLETKTSLFKF